MNPKPKIADDPIRDRRVFKDSPVKPPHMAPCNQCGLCCIVVPCPIAKSLDLVNKHGQCMAIGYDHDNKNFVCGMIVQPLRWVGSNDGRPKTKELEAEAIAEFKKAIAHGKGCDAQIPGD